MKNDNFWSDVVFFISNIKPPKLKIYGPSEFLELGLDVFPITLSATNENAALVVIHKGHIDNTDILENLISKMKPVFANEVFVLFTKKSMKPEVSKSIHYISLINKLNILKANRSTSSSPTNVENPSRMAVYMGNNRVLTETIYGHKIFVHSKDLSLSPHILLDGYWEKWISNVFLDLVQPGMNIIDIGANIGFYSLLAAKNIGESGKLTCFEANPELAEITRDNLNINGLTGNSTVINKAVFSESKTLNFNINQKHMGSSSLWTNTEHIEAFGNQERKIQVEAITLDEYFPKGSIIDFIKIDAEGAEPYILQGAHRILKENNNIKILMEFSPSIIQEVYGSIKKFYREILDIGFHIYRINHDSSLQKLSENDAINTFHCDVLLKK